MTQRRDRWCTTSTCRARASTPRTCSPATRRRVDLKGLKAGSYTCSARSPGTSSSACRRRSSSAARGGARARGGMANMDFNSMSPQQLAAMNDQMDATMAKAVNIYTAQLKNGPNTKGVGNQPLAPQVLPDGTKVFHLTAELANWEVSPGKTVRAWTFNGTVPGPVDQGQRRRPRARRASTTSCRCRPASTSTASRCRSTWTASPTSRRRRSSPASRSPTTSSPTSPSSACTTRTTTRRCRCPTGCSASSRSATSHCRPTPVRSRRWCRWC